MYKSLFALAVPALALKSSGSPPSTTTNNNAKLHFYLVRHGEEMADTVADLKHNLDTSCTEAGNYFEKLKHT